jgi:tetratricopeptide (TPR) repeat protein/predicted Ser/Thr protein kinase
VDGPASIGKYTVVREIARGGMGTVYEAVDPDLNRRVALKVVREGEAGARMIERLHREAAAVARLRHANIVPVHEVGTVRDGDGRITHFIAMDYIAGTTLAAAMPAMSRDERLRVLETVARAVAHAHAQGIVHRDLKPQNVLVEAAPAKGVYLTDFGLAKILDGEGLTRTGATLGTTLYMAPEQVRGEARAVGPWTDVWALGVMLYEMIAGGTPFAADVAPEIYRRILAVEPTPPSRANTSVTRDLETVCLKALEKEPPRRYRTAGEFADDLHRVLAGEPVRARPVSTMERLARKVRRHRPLAIGLTAVVVAAGAVVALQHLASRRRLADEQALAQRRETATRRLGSLWATIVDRKRELRTLASPPEGARRDLEEAVRAVDGHVAEWPGDADVLYVRARGRLYLGDLRGSEADARAAIAIRPEFAPAWSLLGTALLERYQLALYVRPDLKQQWTARFAPLLREAIAAFERSSAPGAAAGALPRSREDDVSERLAVAFRLFYLENRGPESCRVLEEARREFDAEEYARWRGQLGDRAEKRTWMDRALSRAPGYDLALVDRALLRKEAGDGTGAIEDLDLALRVNPTLVIAYYNRGTDRDDQGDREGAMRDFDRLLEIDPAFASAYYNRGLVWRGMGDLPRAERDFARAVELDPQDWFSWTNLGNTRMEQGRLAEALADFDRAVAVTREDAMVFYNRGVARVQAKDLPGALADFDRAVALKPGFAPAVYNRGVVRRHLGDRKGAIEDLTATLRARPDDAAAYFERGRARRESGDPAGAIEDLDAAAARRGDHAGTYTERGRAKRQRGDDAGALADFDRAVALAPEDAAARYFRGDARQGLGDRRGAYEDFDRAIALDPAFAPAWCGRGANRMERGDAAGAEKDLERAVELDPKFHESWYFRGVLRLGARDPRGAIAEFDRAIALWPGYPEALANRGRAREDSGDVRGAIADYEAALKSAHAGWSHRARVEEWLKSARER